MLQAHKKYKAIFFNWDGTAVTSRKAAPDDVIEPMKALLARGVPLVIISGTTYENIAGGRLESYFTAQELQNLFLGLARGAYNYRYDKAGRPFVWSGCLPDKAGLLNIHAACFDIHQRLLREHGLPTDIVFSRPNYCKIDLVVGRARGEQLFMQGAEIEALQRVVRQHGIGGGLQALLRMSTEAGKKYGLRFAVTFDAKYLEVGLASKSDNVDAILEMLRTERGINPAQCSFWGDEYVGLDEGLFGSDSFMMTEKSRPGSFFDVSETPGERPPGVDCLGGGIETFHNFLHGQ